MAGRMNGQGLGAADHGTHQTTRASQDIIELASRTSSPSALARVRSALLRAIACGPPPDVPAAVTAPPEGCVRSQQQQPAHTQHEANTDAPTCMHADKQAPMFAAIMRGKARQLSTCSDANLGTCVASSSDVVFSGSHAATTQLTTPPRSPSPAAHPSISTMASPHDKDLPVLQGMSTDANLPSCCAHAHDVPTLTAAASQPSVTAGIVCGPLHTSEPTHTGTDAVCNPLHESEATYSGPVCPVSQSLCLALQQQFKGTAGVVRSTQELDASQQQVSGDLVASQTASPFLSARSHAPSVLARSVSSSGLPDAPSPTPGSGIIVTASVLAPLLRTTEQPGTASEVPHKQQQQQVVAASGAAATAAAPNSSTAVAACALPGHGNKWFAVPIAEDPPSAQGTAGQLAQDQLMVIGMGAACSTEGSSSTGSGGLLRDMHNNACASKGSGIPQQLAAPLSQPQSQTQAGQGSTLQSHFTGFAALNTAPVPAEPLPKQQAIPTVGPGHPSDLNLFELPAAPAHTGSGLALQLGSGSHVGTGSGFQMRPGSGSQAGVGMGSGQWAGLGAMNRMESVIGSGMGTANARRGLNFSGQVNAAVPMQPASASNPWQQQPIPIAGRPTPPALAPEDSSQQPPNATASNQPSLADISKQCAAELAGVPGVPSYLLVNVDPSVLKGGAKRLAGKLVERQQQIVQKVREWKASQPPQVLQQQRHAFNLGSQAQAQAPSLPVGSAMAGPSDVTAAGLLPCFSVPQSNTGSHGTSLVHSNGNMAALPAQAAHTGPHFIPPQQLLQNVREQAEQRSAVAPLLPLLGQQLQPSVIAQLQASQPQQAGQQGIDMAGGAPRGMPQGGVALQPLLQAPFLALAQPEAAALQQPRAGLPQTLATSALRSAASVPGTGSVFAGSAVGGSAADDTTAWGLPVQPHHAAPATSQLFQLDPPRSQEQDTDVAHDNAAGHLGAVSAPIPQVGHRSSMKRTLRVSSTQLQEAVKAMLDSQKAAVAATQALGRPLVPPTTSLAPHQLDSELGVLSVAKLESELFGLVLIGRGGGGAVFRAIWQGAQVAVKFMLGKTHASVSLGALEAVLAASVNHPHVVQTYGFDVAKVKESSFEEAASPSQAHASPSGRHVPPSTPFGSQVVASIMHELHHEKERMQAIAGLNSAASNSLSAAGVGSSSSNLAVSSSVANAALVVTSVSSEQPTGTGAAAVLGYHSSAPPQTGAGVQQDIYSSFHSDDGFGEPVEVKPADCWAMRDVLNALKAQPGMYLTHIIMEYCDRGTLLGALQRGVFSLGGTSGDTARFNERVVLRAALRTARDVAHGMQHLHMNDIIHGDLKPGNVLLRGSRTDRRGFAAKVADFGLSKVVTSDAPLEMHHWSTVTHMAPEVVHGTWCKQSDVYSFGVLLWQLMTGEPQPFKHLSVPQVIAGVSQGWLQLPWPRTCHPSVARLGMACMALHPPMRPNFQEIGEVLLQIEQNVRDELRYAQRGLAGV